MSLPPSTKHYISILTPVGGACSPECNGEYIPKGSRLQAAPTLIQVEGNRKGYLRGIYVLKHIIHTRTPSCRIPFRDEGVATTNANG
ncbi:hypothetical protein [Methylotenera sp.]|uniref:hypothetical protein n=1 Tax=Methylotenera sp. TaxID=2051956 RepID=UPI002488E6EB|nr:hypothetical protein [Methylotenera sp.]MDI1297704.1 hypothetical protein [Methylotenera sp.]